MSSQHYLISVTIKKAFDLKIPNNEKQKTINPFCILETQGLQKYTEYRLKTLSPEWNQRLDLILPEKPTHCQIKCSDYISPYNHSPIGSLSINLQTFWNNGPQEFVRSLTNNEISSVGEIQMQLVAKEIPSNRRHHYNWTDILHINIKQIQNLPLYAQSLETNSFLRISTELDDQRFAFTMDSLVEGEGLETNSGFFFINDRELRNKGELKVNVALHNNDEDDIHKIGSASLTGLQILKICDNYSPIILHSPSENSSSKSLRPIGKIPVLFTLTPKERIEDKLYDAIFEEYDYNFDGKIDKSELFQMIATLSPSFNFSSFKNTLKRLHFSPSTVMKGLNSSHLKNFLSSSEMHSVPFMNLIILASLRGRAFPTTAHFLRGVTYISAIDCDVREIKARNSPHFIEEKVPAYEKIAAKAFFHYSQDEEIREICHEIMPRLFQRQQIHFKTKQSTTEIFPFIALHKINIRELEIPLTKFHSFDSFLTREIKSQHRPAIDKNSRVCVSPGDLRIRVFPVLLEENLSEIQNLDSNVSPFRLRDLVKNNILAARFYGGAMAVCRFAVKDSFRFNSPINGVQGKIYSCKGGLCPPPFDLKRIGLNCFSAHCRVISELISPEFGSVLVIVPENPLGLGVYGGGSGRGSTSNNSDRMRLGNGGGKIKVKTLCDALRGRLYGRVEFGYAWVVLLFEKGRIQFDRDLVENTKEGFETFVEMNERIGYAEHNNYNYYKG